MLIAFEPAEGAVAPRTIVPPDAVPDAAVWLDLVNPTREEEIAVEQLLGIEVPTREDLRRLEPSDRFYVENGARFMTLSVLCGSTGETPHLSRVSFILARGRLVTVRYCEPRAFALLAARLQKMPGDSLKGDSVTIALIEAIISRCAEVLDDAGQDIERLSKRIFERDRARRDYRAVLVHVGRKEGLTSYVREALNSLSRTIAFLGMSDDSEALVRKGLKADLKSMSRDVQGLSDYANFLANKLQFMLDGTVGLVSLEQNNIIKIFAVLSVVFMPPTLIASIYGMNFQHMPELQLAFGYPTALIAMVVSAIAPYLFFKWRGWL